MSKSNGKAPGGVVKPKRWELIKLFAEQVLLLQVEFFLFHPETNEPTWIVQTGREIAEQDPGRYTRRARSSIRVPAPQDLDCKADTLAICIQDLIRYSVLKSFECDDLRAKQKPEILYGGTEDEEG